MYEIQSFSPTDANYARIVAIQKAIYPDVPITIERTKHGDTIRNPQYLYQRLVVPVNGRIVAVGVYAEPAWSFRPGKYYLEIEVDPAWQGSGIGSALYDFMWEKVAQRDPKPTLLEATTRENLPQGVRFLERRGFQVVMRTPTSEIDLTTFDPSRFTGAMERVLNTGIAIEQLSELQQRDPNWQRKIYDLDWEGTQDEPLPDTPTQMPFDEYIQWYFETPEFLPAGWMVAVDNATGDYVGMAQLKRDLDDERQITTGFTCVARSHRRRGIATALKIKTLKFAQQYGAQRTRTGNEESNPMYQINLRVGFQPLPAWLSYAKEVTRAD